MANSILGRTSALYSAGRVSLSRQVKVCLIRPSMELAEAAALVTCADGFMLDEMIIPRSFSWLVVDRVEPLMV